jgi:hypothetical protein
MPTTTITDIGAIVIVSADTDPLLSKNIEELFVFNAEFFGVGGG